MVSVIKPILNPDQTLKDNPQLSIVLNETPKEVRVSTKEIPAPMSGALQKHKNPKDQK